MMRRRQIGGTTDGGSEREATSNHSHELSLSSLEAGHQTNAQTKSLAKVETRVVTILRFAVLCVLLATAILVSTAVYLYTRNEERHNFTTNFEHSAHQVVESFHGAVRRNLAAVASLSTSITSHVLHHQDHHHADDDNNNTLSGFPFVTVPDFELQGSDLRAISGSHLIYWCPLITDKTRTQWEEYALQNRFKATQAFERDQYYREEQDMEFGFIQNADNDNTTRRLEVPELTVLDDGTNYHPKLWSNGAVTPRGDEPEGGERYLALWQQR